MKNYSKYLFYKLNKKLRYGSTNCTGRNNTGKITVYHKSGGIKSKKYFVDFYRRINSVGYIVKIIKVRNYSSFLGLVIYENGLSSYIIISDNNNLNDKIYSGNFLNTKNKKFLIGGSAISVKNLELFTLINNIELNSYSGSSVCRSAGTCGIITSRFLSLNKITIKLKSGWNILINNNNIVSIGICSNSLHKFNRIKNAGSSRLIGRRPIVRGVAMNPCDHPHGGGNGKKSGLVTAKSPWGRLCKGTPTVIKQYKLIKKKKFKINK